MTTWIIVAVCVVVVGYVATGPARQDDYKKAMEIARKTGNIDPLIEALIADDDKAGTKWNTAISTLWQAYAREAAAMVVVAGVKHCDAKILHYWVQQVMEIEPEIAREQFDMAFLQEHFDPSKASQCGRCGCGG